MARCNWLPLHCRSRPSNRSLTPAVTMMIRGSRFMPPLSTEPVSWLQRLTGYALLSGLAGGFVWTLWRWPIPTTAVTAATIVWSAVSSRKIAESIRVLGHARAGESICTFARALPLRDLDTWVVRATFEQVRQYLAVNYAAFPLRPSDRLVEDLSIDPEDLDDLASDIAKRTGRSLVGSDTNPYFGRVISVEDLIQFICAQPRSAA